MKFLDLEQRSPEWLEYRKSKIAASDAAIVIGMSRYKTPYQLWLEKLDISEGFKGNKYTKYGQDTEEVARIYAEKELKTSLEPMVVQSEKYDWAMASLDGLSEDHRFFVEIKCPVVSNTHELATEGKLTDEHYCQMQYQLMVTGLSKAYYVSYTPIDQQIVEVFRDEEFIERLIAAGKKFAACLISFTPPPLTERDCEMRADDEYRRLLEIYDGAKEKEKQYKEEKEWAKAQLEKLSQGKNIQGFGCRLYQVVRRGNIDYGQIPAIQEMDPEELEQFRKPHTSYWQIAGSLNASHAAIAA